MKSNKSRHRRDVLASFRPGRLNSRLEISRTTGLSAATVSRITRDLVRRELLLEIEHPARQPGRPSRSLRLNGASGAVLGVSLLHPSLRLVLLDLEGRVLRREEAPLLPGQGRAGLLRALEQAVRKGSRGARRGPALRALGAALPGQWDPESGLSRRFPRLSDWRDVPLRDLLARWSGVPATLVGYAPALALAEQSSRAGTEPRNLVTVEVAENIAMGAIVNGTLLEGASGNAGELGHIPFDPDGGACYCGARGCLESFATCLGVIERARASPAGQTLPAGPPALRYEDLVARASGGDAFCARLLGHAARALGRGIAAALSLFNPEVLVLNGRFFDAGDLVMDPLRAAVREFAVPSSLVHLSFQRSILGGDAAALGAGLAAVRDAVRRF